MGRFIVNSILNVSRFKCNFNQKTYYLEQYQQQQLLFALNINKHPENYYCSIEIKSNFNLEHRTDSLFTRFIKCSNKFWACITLRTCD